MIFSEKLRLIRKNKGLTQEELAEKLSVSTRLDSHDFTYSNDSYTYHDTYVGGEQFAGEEAIWHEGKAQYAMNYAGRVLGELFSGDFIYKYNVVGDFTWFQGYEEIYCNREKVYECYFHGGTMK